MSALETFLEEGRRIIRRREELLERQLDEQRQARDKEFQAARDPAGAGTLGAPKAAEILKRIRGEKPC